MQNMSSKVQTETFLNFSFFTENVSLLYFMEAKNVKDWDWDIKRLGQVSGTKNVLQLIRFVGSRSVTRLGIKRAS